MAISKIQARRNAAYLRMYKLNKDAECVDANGEGSYFDLSTGQCVGP